MMRDLGEERRDHWSLDDVAPLLGVPLLDHVERILAEHGRGPLPHGGEPLPDEPPPDPSKVRFGAGSLDGITLGGVSHGTGQEAVLAAATMLDVLRSEPTTSKVHLVAERLAALQDPSAFDHLLGAVAEARGASRRRLGLLARWLCARGVDRQQVKAGLALLGAFGTVEDSGLITKLGVLEELTLYALVALSNLLTDSEAAIFDLAQQVDGWGRIHAVHRLASTTDPTIRRWMLCGGFANAILDEETAFVAATTGGLREALEGDVDDELLDWCGRLLVALAIGGPAQDMSDYPDGEAALSAYLVHVAPATATLERLQHLVELERYLDGWASDNPHMADGQRAELVSELKRILGRPDWSPLVATALASSDLGEVKSVLALAERFGFDPAPVLRSWLPGEPHDAYLWQEALARADRAQVCELVALAAVILPLSALSTAPAKDFGLGHSYRAESCLTQILQRLRSFPGEGWAAIVVGLNCRVTSTRNMALRALATWPRQTWPADAKDLLTRLLFQEPEEALRRRVRDLIDSDA